MLPDPKELKNDLSTALRAVALPIVFATAGLAVAAIPFARVFNAGYAESSQMAAVILAYVVGLVPFCLLFVVQRGFYALTDTRTPFVFTIVQVVLVIAGVLACTQLPYERIAVGIAAVVSLAGTIQLVVAALLLARRIGPGAGAGVTRSLVLDLLAAVPAGLAGYGLLVLLGGTRADGFAVSGILPAIGSMLVLAAGMGTVYLGALLLLRSRDLAVVTGPLIGRFRRG